MDVEIVDDEMPLECGRIALDRAPHMLDEIGFRPRRSARWAEHLTAGDVEVDGERAGAVALAFELPSGRLARSRSHVRRQPLQRLDVRQLVGTHRALSSRGAFSRTPIHRAHVSNL